MAKRRAPPAVDTGRLRASYGASASRTPDGAELEVASGREYAPYLEFGTRRMSPRPFMGPALDAVEPSFTAAMEQLGGDIL